MTADAAVEELLSDVRLIDWAGWAIPLPNRLFAYEPDSVIPAFERLASARTPDEGQHAYNALLDAVGHNHSGTPYTAMSPAAPLLARLVPLLTYSGPAAMDALTDCALWSRGEPAFLGPDGHTHHLEQETRAALRTLEDLARLWAESGIDEARRGAGRGLLEALAELT